MSQNSVFKPSPLTHIDGVDVDEALLDLSFFFQDEDALYNAMLYNPATYPVRRNGSYSTGPFLHHSDNTTYKFQNGTTIVIENTARTALPLDKVESGQDIYDMFVDAVSAEESDDTSSSSSSSSSETSATPSSSASATASSLPTDLGYPKPVITDSKNTISGYFLSTATDVAVLNIQQFEPTTGSEFQSVVEQFLALCKSAQKTRLIIDLRGNPGGISFTGYDLFKQMFPGLEIFSKLRYRSHPAANAIGSALSQLTPISLPDAKQFPGLNLTSEQGVEKYLDDVARTSEFNYHNNLVKPDGPIFSSWADMYGPQSMNGDNFTKPHSWQFSNPALDIVLSTGLVVSGYGDKKNIALQVFDSSNVTVVSFYDIALIKDQVVANRNIQLTDGACSSTCGLFTNLLLSEANVSSVVMGGRRSTNSMTSIGGTQGAQVLSVTVLQDQARAALKLLASDKKQPSNEDPDASQILTALMQPPPLNFAGPVNQLTVNFRDSFSADSDTPRQFEKGRSADCRVFYSSDDVLRVDGTWERIGRGDYDCVDGGKKAWEKDRATPSKATSGSAIVRLNWVVLGVSLAVVFV
jgi:hypothetical protein